jgi:hypothetical protein
MDGKRVTALIYDRSKFKAGNIIQGPAIIMEMDSTTVVLPKHQGRVDALGNVLIYPDGFKVPRAPAKTAVKETAQRAVKKTAKTAVKKTAQRAVKPRTSKSPL